MRKILSLVLILTVVIGSFAVGNEASAKYDEMPPVMKTMSLPIDHTNLLK